MANPSNPQRGERSPEAHPYIAPDYEKLSAQTPDAGRQSQESNWRSFLLRMINETRQDKLLLAARALEDAIFLRYLEIGRPVGNKEWARERLDMRKAAKLLRNVLCDKFHYGRSEESS